MLNPEAQAKKDIDLLIKKSFEKALSEGLFSDGDIAFPEIGIPKEKSHGDFASSFAMASSKSLKMPPRPVADIIVKNMELPCGYIGRAEIAGPGFINFFLSENYLTDAVAAILGQKENFGRTDFGQAKKVMVEFVSANPTGPMHMGNARGGALGDCLSAVLDWSGHDVTREFYINDFGNQIEKFYLSLNARYIQALLGEDAAIFPEDGYHGDDIKERANEVIALYGDKYLNAQDDEKRDALVGYALKKNIELLKSDLTDYRIDFDVWFHESSLYESGEVDAVLDLLEKNGHVYELDGAKWLRLTDLGCEKDEVLVRSNGFKTYMAADIAYHYNKFVTRGYLKAINVWGADHHGHVARMKAAMDAVGLNGGDLDVVLMQMVNIVQDGEAVRMSKRSGNAITLKDLIDEIGVDAARFFFCMRASNTHLDFDLNLAVEQSSQNPVFYVQYAHARICSVLRLMGIDENIFFIPDSSALFFTAPEEIELIKYLARLPEEIIAAAKNYEPERITRFALESAALFHKFYNSCRINADDENVKISRTALTIAVKQILANCFSILKIDAPEKM